MTNKYSDEQIEAAVAAINEHTDAIFEYETTHKDAGDNYSHMIGENWTTKQTVNVVKWLSSNGVDTGGLEDIELAEIAVDNFVMRPSHMFSLPEMQGDKHILGAYPIQEIEIDLRGMVESNPWDVDMFSCVGNAPNAYVRHDGLAYMTTDVVWEAVIDIDTMKEIIAERSDNG